MIRAKFVSALAKMFQVGPGRWVALPTTARVGCGTAFQRGLSGDYSSAPDGVQEALDLLAGKPSPYGRFVSPMGSFDDSTRMMRSVNRCYSLPLAIRGCAPQLGPGRTGTDATLIPGYTVDCVTHIGLFVDPSSAGAWASSYVKLRSALESTVPMPSSGPGADFDREITAARGLAQYGEHDGIARPLINRSEVDAALRSVLIRHYRMPRRDAGI